MKKDMPLVSVIIPAYNVEPYLEKCLDSVNAQSYKNIECVIIIDGATDRTFEIAKNYCSNHSRFKVFYQENAGSGPARNNGVLHSSGEFLCFIDPDDWVEENYVETLLREQQKGNYDLVISQSIDRKINANNEIINTSINEKPSLKCVTKKECRDTFPNLMFKLHYLDGPICKLFRASLIRDNNIKFPSYRRSQDMVFNFRYYNHINSVSAISFHTYNIRYEYPPRRGRGRNFTDYHKIVAKIYDELSEQLKTWRIDGEYQELFYSWSFWYLYAAIIRNVQSHTRFDYVKDEPYRTIIDKARPTLLMHKVVRILLVSKMYGFAKVLIRTAQRLK